MNDIEIVIIVVLALFAAGFSASCVWWFWRFPTPPVMPLFDYGNPWRRQLQADRGVWHGAYAASAVSFSYAPGVKWPVTDHADVTHA